MGRIRLFLCIRSKSARRLFGGGEPRIYEESKDHDDLNGMGTTVVAALVTSRNAYIANMGDSRAYLFTWREHKGEHKNRLPLTHSLFANNVCGMNVKPQDILVSLKLLSTGWPGSFASLGEQLCLSVSETHAAFRRARQAGLIRPDSNQANKSAMAEFMIHSLKYVLAVSPGGRTRGIPTGCAAPPLVAHFKISEDDPDLPVWPLSDGECWGLEIQPLCRTAPHAAQKDAALYEWLVLADALRGAGRARERELAEKIVRERLEYHAPR
ncbi:MAG: hypothetical protein EOM20_21030 [Spartobacteria bacterium]|nr:hypothetical protein [Spartobacteria bacterium]